jgi:cytochrome P450
MGSWFDVAARHRLTGPRAVATLMDLGFASIAAGVIARRPSVLRLLERMQADARAVTRMEMLRREFGEGPVELVIPGRRIVVILDPNDAGRVLAQAPTPFHPASREKRQALQWFEPHGVLVSRGPIRERRRLVNEAALDTASPVHRLADRFVTTIADDAGQLLAEAPSRLDSTQFMTAWRRLVRRLVLGDTARADETITDQLRRLRSAGNWSFLAVPRYRLRAQFIERLYRYAENPHPASLLGVLDATPASGAVDPIGQVPQWLFAFDAAGMALLRVLALLATHPHQLVHAQGETTALDRPETRPYLRACMLESLRLWPTTPTILRDLTEDTQWRDGADRFTITKGAALMIVTPAFHRDARLLPFAHEFTPDIWLDGRAHQNPQLVPFSAGPAECPGRNLVLFVTSTLLANLLSARRFELQSTPRPTPDGPLPMTFNQLALDFDIEPRELSRTM